MNVSTGLKQRFRGSEATFSHFSLQLLLLLCPISNDFSWIDTWGVCVSLGFHKAQEQPGPGWRYSTQVPVTCDGGICGQSGQFAVLP